ncbi:MAG: DUF4262 domain-containing protein [Acidimicrobiales bacterium]|nr:DUF4262 domain-containing protein [Acidimicrobiales bacterium]
MADDVFPDRDMSHRDKVEFMLEREGWALDAVPAQPDTDPPFPRYAYTIGVEDRFAFPELLIVGLTPVACRGLFGLVVDALAGGTELPLGAPFIGLLDGGQPCALLPVELPACIGLFPALAEHRRLAGDADDASTMVQLAWPDPAGVLPWEDGFAAELAPLQVLIGDPPGPRAV